MDPRDRWADDCAASEEWELSGSDLDEVLEWIPLQSCGRPHSLWAVARSPGNVCLVRLPGIDLDAQPGRWPSWASRVYR
ncbi:hypothetical protein AHIS1636_31780 [Arthrobacter mangrovi]|uniref:Uncharacterized protein n=1 Tax=Arthrobacter mangrovi TaxID=2966350 RepID=A0ABQ5MXL1_9MICC|nr:hypothetical protein AHIS1636_31780 [Arthrobacter mangrovi]